MLTSSSTNVIFFFVMFLNDYKYIFSHCQQHTVNCVCSRCFENSFDRFFIAATEATIFVLNFHNGYFSIVFTKVQKDARNFRYFKFYSTLCLMIYGYLCGNVFQYNEWRVLH